MSKQFRVTMNTDVAFEIEVSDDVERSDIKQLLANRTINVEVGVHMRGGKAKMVEVKANTLAARRVYVSSFDDRPKDMARQVPTSKQMDDVWVSPGQREIFNNYFDGLNRENLASHQARVSYASQHARTQCRDHSGFDCCDFMLLLSHGQHLNDVAKNIAMQDACKPQPRQKQRKKGSTKQKKRR